MGFALYLFPRHQNSILHEVGDPVELSVNVTVSGAVPVVGDPLNPASVDDAADSVGVGVVVVSSTDTYPASVAVVADSFDGDG